MDVTYNKIMLRDHLEGINGIAIKYKMNIIVIINYSARDQYNIDRELTQKLLEGTESVVTV